MFASLVLYELIMVENFVRMFLMIIAEKKALLGITPSHTLRSRMVWPSA